MRFIALFKDLFRGVYYVMLTKLCDDVANLSLLVTKPPGTFITVK